MHALINVLDFLIHILFTLYIYAVVIRILLGLTRADFYNPFSKFILSITNPALQPLRRWMPSIGRIDTAALLVIIALKFTELLIRGLLVGKKIFLGSLFIPVFFGLIDLIINLYIFAILALVIISWIAPHMHAQNNPLISVLRSITEPLLRPARKLIPPIGMLDLSAMVVLITLYCVQIFIHSIQL
ncbi:MAG: YggT family protein [Gammaproteobacteria bacterium]|nr:YggT family protein [Gammaproteobacteria bacterium]